MIDRRSARTGGHNKKCGPRETALSLTLRFLVSTPFLPLSKAVHERSSKRQTCVKRYNRFIYTSLTKIYTLDILKISSIGITGTSTAKRYVQIGMIE